MIAMFVVAFLATLGLDWPTLPGNARLPELLFVPAAVAVLATGSHRLLFNVLDAAVVGYLAGSVVGLAVSADRASSAAEFVRHGYLAGIYVLIALCIRNGLHSAVRVGLATMGGALAVVAVVAGFAFVLFGWSWTAAGEVMPLPYIGGVLRLRGFTVSPTMFACVLTAALPFALVSTEGARTPRVRLVWGIVSAVMIVAAAMTFSHVWAGVALAVLLTMWPRLSNRPFVRAAGVAAVLTLALVFNATLIASVKAVTSGDAVVADRNVYPYAVDVGRYTVDGYTVEYAVMSYYRIKEIAAEAFAANPLTGVGLDQFHDVTRAAYASGRLPHGYREIDPHSALLGRLAETGVVGGLTLVALWVAMLQAAARLMGERSANASIARAALAGIAGLLLAGINVDIMNFRFLWVAFGIVRGLSEADL